MQSQTLIEGLAGLLMRPVTPNERKRARLHLMDWAGCAIAGRQSEAGAAFATLDTSGAADAAFFWGALGNVLEMDDVDKRAILHPGPSIIPAALALAGERATAAITWLDAIVRGYEATIRLGRVTGPGHYALWHTTGTCGAIGAAAACATLLNLDSRQTAHALSLAVSQSAGLWQTRHEPGNHGKQLHTANAARAGLTAARLAAAGARGPLSILEGPQGFFAALCPDGTPDALLASYGADWLVHQVSFKPWPACRHAHAAIDAALALRSRTHPAIETVTVRTYRDALLFCDKPDPKSEIEAKFSLQHSVAVALLKGAPDLASFAQPSIVDPAIADLRSRVTVEIGETEEARYPAHYGAEISIAAGSDVVQHTIPDALGDPENPVCETQLIDKATTLMIYGGLASGEAPDLARSFLDTDVDAADLIARLGAHLQ